MFTNSASAVGLNAYARLVLGRRTIFDRPILFYDDL
jgi:hypothetical protein